MSLTAWLASSLFILQLFSTGALADGTGLIGFGKTLYNPTCTFACRNVIRKQKLACTPSSSTENHGTAHNPVSTPPKCFVQDSTFLKTMALCIDVYCTLSDKPTIDLITDYWVSHLGTGTLGDYQYRPLMSYFDALRAARKDEDEAKVSGNVTKSKPATIPQGLVPYQVTSPLDLTIGGSAALNQTCLVDPVQWQLQWNYLSDFEMNERGHSMMSIIIAVIAIALPVLLSLLRHVPFLTKSHGWSYLKSLMVHPAIFGTHHREPVLGAVIPTRGQSLYIFLISFLNIILLLAPYTITQPQASFTTLRKQTVSIVGSRAGTMAMGNVVALILFSSRNSFLLYATDWSYSTYLLLHRWLGYWAVAHTVIHSCMLWNYYVDAGTYAAEILRLYWIWGIVGTVSACALLALSLPIVRRKVYELFVVSHIVLSLLFLIGYYYHIWYVYEYKWGYEIWMFVATGVWALDRLARIVRMAAQGSRTALVTVVPDTDGDYVRIEVEGKDYKAGVAYLCFPTLSWRFWESHPFSVSGVCANSRSEDLHFSHLRSNLASRATDQKAESIQHTVNSPAPSDSDVHDGTRSTTFYARTRNGVTKALKVRALAANNQRIRLRILVDGPYSHSGRIRSQIAQCSSVLCIAGGVGITACLPILKECRVQDRKLFWSSRKPGLVADMETALSGPGASLKVETLIGGRFNLDAILNGEMCANEGSDKGTLAIVVSGPPGLADDVRRLTTQIARSSSCIRAYILVDEAFSW